MFPNFIQVALYSEGEYIWGMGAYIRDVNGLHIWGVYIRWGFYTGVVLTGFYGILVQQNKF